MEEQKNTLPQHILDNNRESTVYMETGSIMDQRSGFETEHAFESSGSGFFVEPDKIITTMNILACSDDAYAIKTSQFETKKSKQFARGYGTPVKDEKEWFRIEGVTAFDTASDLVLLKVDKIGVPLRLGNSDTIQKNDPVYFTGLNAKIGKYQGKAGYIQGSHRDKIRYEIKVEFITGAFGGPILNKDYEVIGVATAGLDASVEDSSTMHTVMVASNVVKNLLAKSGKVIPLTQLKKYGRVRAYILEKEGNAYANEFDNRDALIIYNAARKLNPSLLGIHAKIARMKARLENYVGALRDFDLAIEENPYDFFSYNNRSTTRIHIGDIQGAYKDINKAIEINPDYILGNLNRAQMRCQLADMQIEQDKLDKAKQYYQKANDDLTKILLLRPKQLLARKLTRTLKSRLSELKSDIEKALQA